MKIKITKIPNSKKAFGGWNNTHGGNFSNGVVQINSGGLHSTNPYEGVQVGIDNKGIPNLVEEGEVIYKDYVFSNRLFADKKLLENYNLPTKYNNYSFAYIAEKISKESEERPNDVISKNGRDVLMQRLQQAQEQIRMEKENNKNNKYSKGGKLGNKYDGTGSNSNFLSFYNPDEKLLNTISPNVSIKNDINYNTSKYIPLTLKDKYNTYKTINTNINIPEINSSYNKNNYENWYNFNVKTPTFVTKNKDINNNSEYSNSWLRYAPAIGSGLGVLMDALGVTNTPDYSNSDLVGSVANNLTNVSAKPISNYLTYKPLDTNYYINRLDSQSNNLRNTIINNSNGNRAAANAALLAADYNYKNALGNIIRTAEEYNQAQREKVAAFNRGTNQYNSESALRANIANKENDRIRLQARQAQAQLRNIADQYSSAGRSSNLTNFFDNLGEIGRENMTFNLINSDKSKYYYYDKNGNIKYKDDYYNLSKEDQNKLNKEINNKYSKGGSIKSKRRYLTLKK